MNINKISDKAGLLLSIETLGFVGGALGIAPIEQAKGNSDGLGAISIPLFTNCTVTANAIIDQNITSNLTNNKVIQYSAMAIIPVIVGVGVAKVIDAQHGLIAGVQALLTSFAFKYGANKIDQYYDEIDSTSSQTLESFELNQEVL